MELYDVVTGEVTKEKFHRQFAVPVAMCQEPGDPHTITEMAYVPPKAQIEDMMRSGLLLQEYRKARFGVKEDAISLEEDEQEVGITQGMDLVDVQRAASALNVRLTAVEKARAEELGKEAKRAEEIRFKEAVDAEIARRAAEKAP